MDVGTAAGSGGGGGMDSGDMDTGGTGVGDGRATVVGPSEVEGGVEAVSVRGDVVGSETRPRRAKSSVAVVHEKENNKRTVIRTICQLEPLQELLFQFGVHGAEEGNEILLAFNSVTGMQPTRM